MGKLQWRLLFICGAWWGCDAIEIMLLSFMIPILEKEWQLSPFVIEIQIYLASHADSLFDRRVLSALVASATFTGAFIGTFIWVC